ncbi:3-hydroxyacyl-CoA dehydrogenase NAD-binding domain-containing protein [Candidatus Palauibacter sp.]
MSEAEGVVRTVAIIGAGTMGRRIAYGCAPRGVSFSSYEDLR